MLPSQPCALPKIGDLEINLTRLKPTIWKTLIDQSPYFCIVDSIFVHSFKMECWIVDQSYAIEYLLFFYLQLILKY